MEQKEVSVDSSKDLIAIAALVLMCGCNPADTYGPEQREQGKVTQLIYVPSGHGSNVAVGFNTGKGGGMTVTPVNVDIPARYGIVFQCEHGTFALEGDKYKDLWKSLQQGQEVTIRYRTVYKWKDKKATAYDLDFIGLAQ